MKLVITMSRRFGTGASIIAKELSERLDIPVYDKAYIEEQLHDHMYESEAEAIRKLAEKPCIILGRCASDILKDRMNVLNIFVCADKEDRIRRIMGKENLSYDEAKEKVEKTDEERASYYYEHTGKTWGDVNDYHMIMDTSELGVENCADILMHYFEKVRIYLNCNIGRLFSLIFYYRAESLHYFLHFYFNLFSGLYSAASVPAVILGAFLR